jgi:hypothetical protein
MFSKKGAIACNDLIALFPDKKTEIASKTITLKINESGASAWRDLLAWLTDSRDKILSDIRNRFISQPYYSEQKWSPQIQGAINSVNTITANLQKYIDAAVPDNEGMQLAKQYLSQGPSVVSKYRADLRLAETYESTLSSYVKNIKDKITYNQLSVPPYTITETSDNRGTFCNYCGDRIRVVIDGTIHTYVDKEDKSGKYYPEWGSSISGYSTLGEAIIEVTRFKIKATSIDCWACFESVSDMARAETIERQYQQYGMSQWYKINR